MKIGFARCSNSLSSRSSRPARYARRYSGVTLLRCRAGESLAGYFVCNCRCGAQRSCRHRFVDVLAAQYQNRPRFDSVVPVFAQLIGGPGNCPETGARNGTEDGAAARKPAPISLLQVRHAGIARSHKLPVIGLISRLAGVFRLVAGLPQVISDETKIKLHGGCGMLYFLPWLDTLLPRAQQETQCLIARGSH